MSIRDKIKNYIKDRELKKLTDKDLVERVEEKKEKEEEMQEIPNIIGYINDDEKQLKVAEDAIDSELDDELKAEILRALPKKSRANLFKQDNVVAKKIIAQDDIDTFTEILVREQVLKPYNELYYRLDVAFSDSQVAQILSNLETRRNRDYDPQKVLKVIAKQIAVDIKTHRTFLPSHLKELTDKIIIDLSEEEIMENESDIEKNVEGKENDIEEKKKEIDMEENIEENTIEIEQNERTNAKAKTRKFDILREDDRQNLYNAIMKEAEILKHKAQTKEYESEQEKNNELRKLKTLLTPENVKNKINDMVKFQERRNREIATQISDTEKYH